MTWWQILILMGSGMAGAMLAVFLGGYIVFRAAMQGQVPFVQKPRIKDPEPWSYVNFGDDRESLDAIMSDDSLSPAAARLRAQKLNPDAADPGLDAIRGKK